MRTNERGFTLIELVVVIVILGILAATALPKFVDLTADAGNAAAEGVAGSLASATSINYAASLAGNASAVTISGCADTDLEGLVTGVTLDVNAGAPTGNNTFHIQGAGTCTSGTTAGCTIAGANGSATATITCSN